MEPHARRRVSSPVERIAPRRRAAVQGLTVLLVTGDADLRAAGARVLADAGYRTLTAAHSGHAWLACLRAGTVDVLLTELSMQDMSGPVLAEWLRRLQPGLEPLYLANPGTPARHGIIVRPFNRDDLLKRIRTLAATTM